MDPDRDLTPLRERCSAEGWLLEIPTEVKGQWRYFSGTDRDRRAALQEASVSYTHLTLPTNTTV